MLGTLAAYTRTSIEDYDKSHHMIDQSCSIVSQRHLIQGFVSHDRELSTMRLVEYVDDGFTGTNFDRPKFQEMMAAARLGHIQCIVVKDLSRLGRSYLEVGEYLERTFPLMGVRLIAISDGYDSKNYEGSTGGIDIAFRNFIYDSYSKDLSAKVKTAMKVRMEKGKFVNQPPFGYLRSPVDKHQMIPDPETAPVVREIFRMILTGKTTSEAAKELNRRKIPTPLQYKRHKLKPACQGKELMWTHYTVLNILRNYKYTGAMVNHTRESRMLRDRNQRRTSADEWIITEGTHEALISKEDFEAAQTRLRHPAKCVHQPREGNDNVFFCGCCGRKLRKTHGLDTYFSCDTPMYRENAACAGVRWSKNALEEALLPVYRAQLKLLGEQAAKQDSQALLPDLRGFIREMARIEQTINQCESQKVQLYEAFHDGKIDQETFLNRKQALVQRQEELRGEYALCEENYRQGKQTAERWQQEQTQLLQYLSENGLPDDIAIKKMYAAIDRVIVFDNEHIEVRWKFEDLFRTLPDAIRNTRVG